VDHILSNSPPNVVSNALTFESTLLNLGTSSRHTAPTTRFASRTAPLSQARLESTPSLDAAEVFTDLSVRSDDGFESISNVGSIVQDRLEEALLDLQFCADRSNSKAQARRVTRLLSQNNRGDDSDSSSSVAASTSPSPPRLTSKNLQAHERTAQQVDPPEPTAERIVHWQMDPPARDEVLFRLPHGKPFRLQFAYQPVPEEIREIRAAAALIAFSRASSQLTPSPTLASTAFVDSPPALDEALTLSAMPYACNSLHVDSYPLEILPPVTSRSPIPFESNTKYKPVAKKVLPLARGYPAALNRPMRRPVMSRNPYSTPLTPSPPPFQPGERLTTERLQEIDFGPPGFLSDQERLLLLHVLRIREKAIAFTDLERGLLKSSYADPYKFAVVDHAPWQIRQYPIRPALREQTIQLLQERLDTGLYERTTSAYSSVFFPVPKKNGKLRLVHSLEPLNAVTIRDAGVPPIVEDFIEDLSGRSCMGLLDIYGGYDERDLDQDSRPLTAFQTPIGHLQLTRLPQGFTNAVAEQMRITRHVLAEDMPSNADCFLDDIPVKGPRSTYNDAPHEENPQIRQYIWEYAVILERILFRLEESGLTASGKKLVAFANELDVLGSTVSFYGRRISTHKQNKILRWPIPETLFDVRSFIGMCTFVRVHIPQFSDISSPLRRITRKNSAFDWTDECQKAFDRLKTIVGKNICLKKLDYSPNAGLIILAVDSSQTAAGAGLFQLNKEGIRCPARYESITFTDVEARYSQPKLELCGLVKCLRKLAPYIWGVPFRIEVDAISLIQMVNSPDPIPNAAANRWIAYLHLFDFEIVHVKGEKHKLADALSRVRRTPSDSTAESINEVLSNSLIYEGCFPGMPVGFDIFFLSHLYPDDDFRHIGRYLESLTFPPNTNHRERKLLKLRAQKFLLRNGKLFRKATRQFHDREVVLLKDRQQSILRELHDDLGHRGTRETYGRVILRYWWPSLLDTVQSYVKSCLLCQLRSPRKETEKRRPGKPVGLFKSWSFDVIHVKYGRYPYLVTAHDELTGWPEAMALTKIDAAHVAVFIRDILTRFGQFHRARLDNGSEFKAVAQEAFDRAGVQTVRIAPNHPQANGQEERGHIPLMDCIYKLARDHPGKWYAYLPYALYAERISVKKSTGFSPFQLLYLTEPVLPIDKLDSTWLISEWDTISSHSSLLAARARQLIRRHEDLQVVAQKLEAARLAGILYHDKKNAHRLRQPLEPGDLVLIQNVKLETQWGLKLADRWFGPYEIRERLPRGSYLLKEVGPNGAHLLKAFAAFRLRRFFPRGRPEDQVNIELLAEDEDSDIAQSDLEDEAMSIQSERAQIDRFVDAAVDRESDKSQVDSFSDALPTHAFGSDSNSGDEDDDHPQDEREPPGDVEPQDFERVSPSPAAQRAPSPSRAVLVVRPLAPPPSAGPTLIVRPLR
jgi:hypothetical protein